MNNITLFPTDDPDFISFEYGAPGPDLMPSQDLLNEAMKHRVSSSHSRYSTCQYGPSLGDIHFRQLLKEWLSMDTLPIVTSGASQSLSNIITLFTDSNTRFLIEDPSYFLAIKIFEDHGIGKEKLGTISVDADGMKVDELEKYLQQQPRHSGTLRAAPKKFPYLLYTVPTFSNPSGTTISTERRIKLIEIARKFDVLVVCDDVYTALHFNADTSSSSSASPSAPLPPSLISLEQESLPANSFGNVISNGSFSKLFCPGLRLGWLESTPAIINQFLKSGLLYSGGSPNHFASGIMASALQLGLMQSHLNLIKKAYTEKRDHLVSCLNKFLPRGCAVVEPKYVGGFFIWVECPESLDTTLLMKELKRAQEISGRDGGKNSSIPTSSNSNEGGADHQDDHRLKFSWNSKPIPVEKVSFAPGNAFSASGKCGRFLRLTFAFYSKEDLERGVQRISKILEAAL